MLQFLNIAVREAVTDATEAVEVIHTPYSDMTIPLISIIAVGVGIAILLAAMIVGVILIRRRTRNFGYSVLTGIAAYITFCYLFYVAIFFLLGKIGSVKAFFDANPETSALIQLIAGLILEALAIFVGVLVIRKLNGRSGRKTDISVALGFGLAFFIATLIVNNVLTTNFEYILACVSINRMGFDEAVTLMVQNGLTEEAAIESVYGMCVQPWYLYLVDGLSYVIKAVLLLSVTIIVYGVQTRQLSKYFYFAAFGLEIVYYVPGLFKSETTAAGLIRFGTSLLIAAYAFRLAVRLTKRYMPMDYRILKRAEKPEKPKDDNKPQEKMPKIVMPD